MRRPKKNVETAFISPRKRYDNLEPNAKSFITWPVEETRQSATRIPKRNMIWTLTILSRAVRLMGAAVAFRISFVSCPVKTTMPYIQGVFRNVAPCNLAALRAVVKYSQ